MPITPEDLTPPAVDPEHPAPPSIPMTAEGIDDVWTTICFIAGEHSAKKKTTIIPYLYPLADWLFRVRLIIAPYSSTSQAAAAAASRPAGEEAGQAAQH